MNGLLPACIAICVFLLAYLLHSTLAVVVTEVIAYRLKGVTSPELRVLVWKLALSLPLVSALAVIVFDLPHFGIQFPISMTSAGDRPVGDTSGVAEANAAGVSNHGLSETALANRPREGRSVWNLTEHESADEGRTQVRHASESIPAAATSIPRLDYAAIWLLAVTTWMVVVVIGFIKLGVQLRQLRQLRRNASCIVEPELCDALNRLREHFRIRRRVALLQSANVEGPMTAGVFCPFILFPVGMHWEDAAERDALLAHELVHIARRDAFWNLAIQVLCRAFPFQPLNWFAGRQLRKEMDFVADALAARTSQARTGLAQCLIRLGDQLAGEAAATGNSPLAACMASFDSMLGKRIEVLLTADRAPHPPSFSGRLAVVVVMVAGAAGAAAVVPRAVAQTSKNLTESDPLALSRNHSMNRHFSTLAILAGLTMPSVADEPQATTQAQAETKVRTADLKTTPDPLPKGIHRFNGMLVGRLAAKDVEKGTFLVQIDAVPRVWRNSRAEDPKSIVGKAVEISGVFGRFLDVLVVTRIGETVEFECKDDGDRLVFPGELLRKVAAYDPSDYPVLPEAFRGFQGAVAATVAKKDPETFELIVKVDRVLDTWKDNKAKEAKSIEGKPLMLAGFWNRKDAYHGLKVGDKIEVGMQHIGLRSDHLTVAEYARKAGERADREVMKKEGEASAEQGLTKELRGFRGMLVGRLVEKDVERGTFAITVDAVPRVWKNNRASSPKSLLGTNVAAEGVAGKMLDSLVVAKLGETIEFGALHDGGERMRVGEVLRKVAPVKPGDYPELPDDFRGFKGMVTAKVIRKDDHLMDMVVEITEIKATFPASRAKKAEAILGQRAMLAGFWQRKDAFHSIGVGDTIECGIEHPQQLSDHLSVIESVKKVEKK